MDCIKCVADVLEIVKGKEGPLKEIWHGKYWRIDGRDIPISQYTKFPHGIWFRGQPNAEWKLIPSVFRKKLIPNPGYQNNPNLPEYHEDTLPRYEEAGIYQQFQLRQASYREVYKFTFDWLCLMQHYRLPTRLLDWSESILVALYFAVKDDSEETKCKDAKLFALSSLRLNKAVNESLESVVYTPNDLMVGLRVEAATDNMINIYGLFELVASRYEFGEEAMAKNPDIKVSLAYPVAVHPFRLNDRMTFQASVFTIHGGKYYTEKEPPYRIPNPKNLEGLDEKQKDEDKNFLKSFFIPQKYKESIKDELERIGIHEGTLFPELDYQASYIKRQWELTYQ